MQYFLGLEEFDNPVFDPSLFVEIRKRIGHEQFDKQTLTYIFDYCSNSYSFFNTKGKASVVIE